MNLPSGRPVINLGSRIVNNYLLPCEDGYILIDTGYENGCVRFLKNLKRAGVRPSEIKTIFLTHAHDDHAGFLNDVLALTDAGVILHPRAIDGLMRGQNSFAGGCSGRLAHSFCRVLALLGKGEHRYPPIRREYLDRLIPIGSEALRGIGLPFQVIETPGHTADSISLLAGDVLFCGDAAMNGFPSRRRTTIWIEDLAQFRQSWKKMLECDPALICPAHGKPFPPGDLRRYLPALDRVRLYPLKPRLSSR